MKMDWALFPSFLTKGISDRVKRVDCIRPPMPLVFIPHPECRKNWRHGFKRFWYRVKASVWISRNPFNPGAGLNPTVSLALIISSSPVCGFLPVLAFLFLIVNVPKSGYENLLSFFTAFAIFSKVVSIIPSIAFLLKSQPHSEFWTALLILLLSWEASLQEILIMNRTLLKYKMVINVL